LTDIFAFFERNKEDRIENERKTLEVERERDSFDKVSVTYSKFQGFKEILRWKRGIKYVLKDLNQKQVCYIIAI
jgi:hypothetical protein